MPMAIPLLAAAGSIGAGIAAVSAGSMVVGGLMIAGGMLGAVGTISGDQKLSRFGSVLSLAGGVSGMASGAWQETAKTVASDAALNTGAPLAESSVMDTAAATAANSGNATAATAGASELASGGANAVDTPLKTLWGDSMGAGVDQATGGLIEGNLPQAGAGQAANTGAPGLTGADSPLTSAALPPATPGASMPAFNPPANSAVMQNFEKSGESFWQSMTKGLRENKEVAYLGGSLIQGAMKSHTDQQSLRNQQRYDQTRRDQYNASLRNLRAPVYQGG